MSVYRVRFRDCRRRTEEEVDVVARDHSAAMRQVEENWDREAIGARLIGPA